ncbi:MAG: sigma 54-interacting transcriptional regulator [Labilithrix sp.]|nr:sigma 54-interacting transcriptional regulator [Labilithrix sp.]MCW5817704.1 sigma 54-interacting transcriptional regulator [Labilithrix sp.]
MPPRYDVVALLGKGGGGEVWAVRDRVTGRKLALKVLAEDAGEAEVMALVREAVTLSGLEGLGVPQVLAFGRLPGSTRRWLVRELVEGQSLEAVYAGVPAGDGGRDWLVPLASAADQLTVLHRAGLLHGDIKPANVIVGPDRSGTLVDLGLATPWREGGARAKGLTPKYAAPELFHGEPLTVRAEVYALGATLRDGLRERRTDLDDATFEALEKIAARATADEAPARYPSVDELASALKSAAKIETREIGVAEAWPVLGADAAAQALAADVARLGPGQGLAIVGPRRSGRSTLAHRLTWTLGVSGAPVAGVQAAHDGAVSSLEVIEMELAAWMTNGKPTEGLVIVVEDLADLGNDARARLREVADGGARIVAVGGEDEVAALVPRGARSFVVPPLDDASAGELVKRAIPSLPDSLTKHLLERTGRRPGLLRSFVRRLEGRAVTSIEEIDELLDATSSRSIPPTSQSRDDYLRELRRALETGRFDVAATALERLGTGLDDDDAVELAIARSRVCLARGDAAGAATALTAVAELAKSSRPWKIARARTFTRAGDYAAAARLAEEAARGEEDAIAADALAVQGVALAYTGDEATAKAALERAVALAQQVQDARTEAVALVSMAILHQRGGRAKEAREAYEAALVRAEKARDAWMLANTRLNLATITQNDGDLAQAIVHLEAAIDMGRRAGALLVVQQALFNLANLDLYLGRFARAGASIENLTEQRDRLAPVARAQLLGLQAEHATRLGDIERGARLYELCADAYDAVGRPLDAAEARLEGILIRLGATTNDPGDAVEAAALAREVDALAERLGEGGFREHEALAGIVRGSLALARGDEELARAALDAAYERAVQSGQREWSWRALDARARLAAMQGAISLARRDTDASLAMLEETARKLPRDLREVFWNDPRRRAIRQAHTATMPVLSGGSAPFARGMTTGLTRTASITSMGIPMPAEDRLMRIFEITRDLARERDLPRLLQQVTDHAVGLLGAERGLIVLVNDEGEVVAHTARGSKGEESHTNFSRSVAERVIREGEPVIATSARDDERLAQAVSVHQLMIQSIACVPIRGAEAGARTIGALYLETRLRPGVRFRDELPTLAAFADQAAIAIESARVLDELRRRSDELAKANAELAAARDKLAERLESRTEQLTTARRELKQARSELRGHFGYGGLIGTSAAMRKVYALIDRIKDADVPVLITGESGTGKEVIAKAIHAAGPRSKSPFLGVNCGAIPANLLESELFGHVRGAFTGADRDRKGLFREADSGTILLDEIGEMPLKMQAGLLRVLQEKTVRPVGGAKEESCNARVVAATNRDLSHMVAEGSFREDLFYRLHVIELKIPPLRERAEDIPALIDHFLKLFSARHKRERKAMDRAAVRRLQAYDWPGNVRQLEHVLLNAWLLSEEDEIVEDDLDLPSTSTRPAAPEAATAAPRPAPEAKRPRNEEEHKGGEKEKILAALAKSNWNRVQAAKLIGIPRRTFYRRLKEYGIV